MNTRPTIRLLRYQHDLTLAQVSEQAQVEMPLVLVLDEWNVGEARVIDRVLQALSQLSGVVYRRDLLNVGSFTFCLTPPAELIEAVSGHSAGEVEASLHPLT